jgi:hypothetical protein
MSKFLNLCGKIESLLNEQGPDGSVFGNEQQPAPDQASTEQPTTEQPQPMQDNESSEIRIASNDDIIQLINSIKLFYEDGQNTLDDDEIKIIKSLDTSDPKNDTKFLEAIDKLKEIFNPVSVKTNPETVKDSEFNS